MHSQLSIDDHQKLVDTFQEDEDGLEIIVEGFQVMGVRYTMHRARYIIIMEPQFTMNVKNQAKKRAHRIGIKKETFCYRLICLNHSVEKGVVRKADIRAQFIVMAADVRKDEGLVASNTDMTPYLKV